MPLLTVAQKTVQPEPHVDPGPHTDAYADCGLSRKPTLSTARALPTTADRASIPRREVRRASQPVTASTVRCDHVSSADAFGVSACRACAVLIRSARPSAAR